MRKQINEFKFINRLAFLPIKLRKFCKKFSVANDSLFEFKRVPNRDYFGDPAYSSSMLNMFHDNRRP
jgi:hypothetical protein